MIILYSSQNGNDQSSSARCQGNSVDNDWLAKSLYPDHGTVGFNFI